MAEILLLGSSGMLGSAIQRCLAEHHAIVAPPRSACDLLSAWPERMPVPRAGWVINAAGLIPRRCASDADMLMVNARFPLMLAAHCERLSARLLHVSTDCVFAGLGPHDETHRPNAPDIYGRSKAMGEPTGAMVLRTSIIGPENGAETAEKANLLCWTLRQCVIDGYTNHIWNGVTTWGFARIIEALIAKDMFRPGVTHVVGETVTKCALIAKICRAFGHQAMIRPVPAPLPRDQRLASIHAPLPGLGECLDAQLERLASMSSKRGQWLDRPGRAAFE
jgi:dTDP-4-dehydrorhamnose reductase